MVNWPAITHAFAVFITMLVLHQSIADKNREQFFKSVDFQRSQINKSTRICTTVQHGGGEGDKILLEVTLKVFDIYRDHYHILNRVIQKKKDINSNFMQCYVGEDNWDE